MGVHGLWDLLAPVGRRVSVETLSGKKLAIDASIWMVQFMKAMRDERGEMVRNAHLLGFFRRICKLLFLRTKPVFVFDGGTPVLKRRTVIARRRQRENAQTKIRKTAEKLLLNHLKAMRLKDLAKDLENQRKNQKNDAKGKEILIEQGHVQDSNTSEERNMESADAEINNEENLDERLAASLVAEKDRHLNNNDLSTAHVVPDGDEGDSEENEEIIWPGMDGSLDPAVLAALPTAMQLDLMMRNTSMEDNGKNREAKKGEERNGNAKSKEVFSKEMDILERDNVISKSYNQKKLDEMLAASLAAEESESLTKIASTSDAEIPLNFEGDDEDEEMILPAFPGKVDLAILAALPPSMQLDLLVQMRERLMAENRKKYQKVKKTPEKFSELQIEAYLKTVSFRREIDQVQKAAAGKDVGGIQTSRIASEASKEFIFSSSFTGDKQLLTSAGVHGYGEKLSDSVNHIASTGKSGTVSAFVQDESSRIFNEDVETYVDERGRVRVSRVRAMGIRMTRDLQRNLDLMKEIELEKTHPIKTTSSHSELCGDEMGSQKSIPSKEHNSKLTNDYNANSVKLNETNVQPIFNNESSIQISFEVDGGSGRIESDDDVFTSLVVGQPVMISSDSASDSDWVEGIIDRNDECSSKDFTLETNASVKESYINDDSEVEWEEVVCDVRKNANSLSRDKLVEQSDLEEAIRRSLEDFGGQKVTQRETGNEKIMNTSEVAHKGVKFFDTEANSGKMHLVERDGNQQNKPFPEISAAAKLDGSGPNDSSHLFSSPQKQLKFSEACDTDNLGMRINRSCQPDLGSDAGQPTNIMNKIGNLGLEIHSEDSVEAKEIDMIVDGPLDTCVEDVRLSTAGKTSAGDVSVLKTVSPDKNFSASVDVDANKTKTEISLFINEKKFEAPSHAVELTNRSEPFEGSRTRILVEPVSEGEKKNILFNENDYSVDEFPKDENLQGDFSEANLQEEILCLNQERITLGHEQKKLERNAESVSSEMFAECQELLQMFGIPYIIAPMEAEAQCAYMELANLVDGVVTDDSDVFLFGGRSVYKNIFDDRKYVETYLMKDIEKELGLTRGKLIHMALLLGSDYTEGISGIGIVNAIEVVNAFPEEDGLEKFREWIDSPDPNILGKFDANRQAHGRESCTDHYQLKKQIFMNKHRTVSKNWHVPSSFPSKAVMSAYFSPQVDKSTDPFTWGKPDINVLRRLCWEKFGWGVQKSDELLIPVLKEYNKHETQLRLEAFYSFNERFAKIRSNRIKKAVKGITGNQSSGLMDDAVVESSRSRKKRTIRSGESGDINTEKPSKRAKRGVRSFKNDDPSEKATRKQSRKRTAGEPVSSEVEIRGRGRGQGHRRGRGRDLGKGILDSKQSDSSSDDFSGGCDNLEVCVEKSEISGKLRRSTRTRKPANYVPNDSDIDDVELSDQEAIEQSDLVRFDVEFKDTGKSQNCQEHRSVEDPLPEDFSREHLQMGVGFVNEDGSGNAGASQDNCPYEAVSTEDYLKMGGGFCLDESEMDAEPGAARSPSLAAARDAADVSFVSNLTDEAHSRKDSVQSVLGVKETSGEIQVVGWRNSTDANMGLDCANKADTSGYSKNLRNITESKTALPSLSAMPFLKRKRRKSWKQSDA